MFAFPRFGFLARMFRQNEQCAPLSLGPINCLPLSGRLDAYPQGQGRTMLGLTLNHVLQRFFRHTGGNIAILFALAVVPIMLIAGFAVDFLRASQSRTQIQAVLDAAVLAVAKAEGVPVAERKARGMAYFKQNFSANEYEGDAIPQFKITKDRIIGTVKLQLPTTILKLTGNKSLEVAVTAEAMRPITGSAEVVMVLDYSNSMRDNNKVGRMSAVARDFIDQLTASMGSTSNLQFGLVPFSDMVAVVDFPKHAVLNDRITAGEWEQNGGGVWNFEAGAGGVGPAWTGCTQDREYPLNRQDTTPDAADERTKWGKVYHLLNSGPGGQDVPAACSAYLNRNLAITPLSSNYNALKSTLAAMTPYWNTNIALGAEFGWHMLTPNTPFHAHSFTKKDNHKFMILLTDGMQTTNGRGAGQVESVSNAVGNLDSICGSMKGDGITIFTIGYDVNNVDILNRLENCASPGKYFDADVVGSNDLTKTFKDIAEAIKTSLIYLSN